MIKLKSAFVIIFLTLLTAGCSTTKKDFVQFSMNHKIKNPQNYCAYSIPQTYTGHYPSYLDGRYACGINQAEAEQKSLKACADYLGRSTGCMVAFLYVLQENKIYNWEEHHVNRTAKERGAREETQRIARLEWEKKQNEKLMQTCDRYGFKRGTADHSNCVLQVATTNRIQEQKENESAAQAEILQEIKRQQALNSLINLNNSLNPPKTSITCNPSGLGGMTCK
jgi:hypothetical protein